MPNTKYSIDAQPYVIVKANSGTYGMGVMSVKDASESIRLNRHQRNKMAVIKRGRKCMKSSCRKGLHTFESLHDAVAEPVVYA